MRDENLDKNKVTIISLNEEVFFASALSNNQNVKKLPKFVIIRTGARDMRHVSNLLFWTTNVRSCPTSKSLFVTFLVTAYM